jgi:hypothetical protein
VEVQDKAGNIGHWESPLFAIDNIIPLCEIIGDKLKFTTNEIALDYKLTTDNYIKPEKVKFVYKKKEWKEFKIYSPSFPFGERLKITLDDGKYDVGVICTSEYLIKQNIIPQANSVVLKEITIGTKGPQLFSASAIKPYYKVGDTIKLSWNFKVENPAVTNKVGLYISFTNKTYTKIDREFDYIDSFSYKATGISKKLYIKIVAKDELNNRTEKLYKTKIDPLAPRIKFIFPKISNSRNVPYQLNLFDKDSGIKKVVILAKEENSPHWQVLEQIENFQHTKGLIVLEGKLTFQSDSLYNLKIVATDWANNKREYQTQTLIDTIPPRIKIEIDKVQFLIGEIATIKITPSDNIEVENLQIFLSRNGQHYELLENNYLINLYTYKFVQEGTYSFKFIATDKAQNKNERTIQLKVEKPPLTFPVDFGGNLVKTGNVNFKIILPHIIQKHQLTKIELLGKKEDETSFKSYGNVDTTGTIELSQGCYQFVAIGYINNSTFGDIQNPTKVCAIAPPEISFNIQNPYLVYSKINKLILDYKISNFKAAELSYSFDNKQFKPYAKLSQQGTISFELDQLYEGPILLKLTAYNQLDQSSSKTIQINYDDIPPSFSYEWENLKIPFFPPQFKDTLKLSCQDNFLQAQPITIFTRHLENAEFSKLSQLDSKITSLEFDFSNYNKIQFKLVCSDLAGNQKEIISPFYSLDNSPPQIQSSCKLQNQNNSTSLSISYQAQDNESGIYEIEVNLYKNNSFFATLYKGNKNPHSFLTPLKDEGNFFIEISAKDNIGNSIKHINPNCYFNIDLTPPQLTVNLPPSFEFPANKSLEFSYSSKDNNKIDKVQLVEIINDKEVIIATSLTDQGTFKIPPENTPKIKNFKVVAYDLSSLSSSYNFSVNYKQLKLSYEILNPNYINTSSFVLDFTFDDSPNLIDKVELYLKKQDQQEFTLYPLDISKDRKITLEDGCYILSVIAKSKFGDRGDPNKTNKKICIVTQKPIIKISAQQPLFFKDLIKIPFEIQSIALDENSIQVFYSQDKGITWQKLNKLFRAKDEIILQPNYEGNLFIKIYAKDLANNENTLLIDNIFLSKTPLTLNVDFGGNLVKTGNVNFKIILPHIIQKHQLTKIELLGKKEDETSFKSYGNVDTTGTIELSQGCYQFVAIGYINNSTFGDIQNPTKVCAIAPPEISFNIQNPYLVYSKINKLILDYKISNFKAAELSYSFDNKQFKPYAKLSQQGTISFELDQLYEGPILLKLTAYNQLDQSSSKTIQINYDDIPPSFSYEWENLKIPFFPPQFKDTLKLSCQDNFLQAQPITIFTRHLENAEFSKLSQLDSKITSLEFDFSNYNKIQFKLVCPDLAGNQKEIISPFYSLDNSPPQIQSSCKLQNQNNSTSLSISYQAQDNESGIYEIEVNLYKNNSFFATLYKGNKNPHSFLTPLKDEGNFFIEISAKDNIGNSIKHINPNCYFNIDLTPPQLTVNLPHSFEFPANKSLEFSYSSKDNNKIDKVQLVEIINDKEVIIATSLTDQGTFKIPPENTPKIRNFKVVAYDLSSLSSSYNFSVNYKQLKLSYEILNPNYINTSSFLLDFAFDDSPNLIDKVELYLKKQDQQEFTIYPLDISKDRKITLEDGCYILSVIAKSKFGDTGDPNKTNKKICIVTQKPIIKISTQQPLFFKDLIKIPFEIQSIALDENSIQVFYSQDKGITWQKLNKLFRAKDEIILQPNYEGNLFIKIYAKDLANNENTLIIDNIFLSKTPPLCIIQDNLIFNTKTIKLPYNIQENLIPVKEVYIKILKENTSRQEFIQNTKNGEIEVDLEEGIYKVECRAVDLVGNVSEAIYKTLTIDYTKPQIIITRISVKKIDADSANILIHYKFEDNMSATPKKVEIYTYNFINKKWKKVNSFTNLAATGEVEILLPLFGKFGIGIASEDLAGNIYTEPAIIEGGPPLFSINLLKPHPKIITPVDGQILLNNEPIEVKYSCKSKNSQIVNYTELYLFDEKNQTLIPIFTNYPTKGSYTYIPTLESGKYSFILICKSKFGLEFKDTKKFFIVDRFPKIKVIQKD